MQKLMFLRLHSHPHAKFPNICHKTKALQNYEKRNKNKEIKVTQEDDKKK